MPRARFLAMAGLPLLATLLAAQAPPLPPKKPAPAAEPKKTTPAVQPKKTAAKKPEPKKYAIEDYRSLWDVNGKTTRADIVARFGQPQRIGDSSRSPYYYFDDTLVFFFSSEDTVGTMIVGNSFSPIPPNAFPPDIIEKSFIGKRRDDVLKAFGPANVVSSENYRYSPKSRSFYKVEFQCYDFRKYVCGQLLVQF